MGFLVLTVYHLFCLVIYLCALKVYSYELHTASYVMVGPQSVGTSQFGPMVLGSAAVEKSLFLFYMMCLLMQFDIAFAFW